MGSITADRVFPADETIAPPLLIEALAGIPERVRPATTMSWHYDMVRGVAPVRNRKGSVDVMYSTAAPWLPRNKAYTTVLREAFRRRFPAQRLPG